jgi:hypothetical protein
VPPQFVEGAPSSVRSLLFLWLGLVGCPPFVQITRLVVEFWEKRGICYAYACERAANPALMASRYVLERLVRSEQVDSF